MLGSGLASSWLRLDPGFCSPTRTANLSIVPHSGHTGQRRNDHSHPTSRVTALLPPQVGCVLPCHLRGGRDRIAHRGVSATERKRVVSIEAFHFSAIGGTMRGMSKRRIVFYVALVAAYPFFVWAELRELQRDGTLSDGWWGYAEAALCASPDLIVPYIVSLPVKRW